MVLLAYRRLFLIFFIIFGIHRITADLYRHVIFLNNDSDINLLANSIHEKLLESISYHRRYETNVIEPNRMLLEDASGSGDANGKDIR